MSHRFAAEPDPSAQAYAAIAALAPRNPFRTGAYAAALRETGLEPWVLALLDDEAPVAGCIAFLARGRLEARLDIPSLPELPSPEIFWRGLSDLCRDRAITELSVGTFASTSSAIPALGRELSRKVRAEYSLSLSGEDPWSGLSSNHRRNFKKAERAGVQVRRVLDLDACRDHVRLMAASTARREGRESDGLRDDEARSCAQFTEHGAGELLQAVHEGEILSSVLVLRAAAGAYYHSAGTLPEGMKRGASHFLIRSIAERLRQEGLEIFNLGGADPDQTGLARFKQGFGADRVDLEAARFSTGPPFRRALSAAWRVCREAASRLPG